MAGVQGARGARQGEWGWGIEGLKALELCVCHNEVCGGWEGEGERVYAPKVVGVAAHWVLKEARLQGELI